MQGTINPAVYRRFMPVLRPYRGRLVVMFLATLARPILNTAKVWLLKLLIDGVIRGRQPGLLLWVCVGYGAIALAKAAASFTDNYLGGTIGARIVRDLRTMLYDHLQGMSLRFFHTQRLGDLLTRLSGDISAIEDLLVAGSSDLLAHSLTILLFLGMLFYLDARLALVTVVILPALTLATARYVRRTRTVQQEIRERASVLTSIAEEGLSAIALVKSFAREPREHQRYAEAADGSFQARVEALRLQAFFTPLVDCIATTGTILVVWFGAQEVLNGRLSLGALVVFLGYLGSLYTPIQGLSRLGGVIQRARVGAERVIEVLDADPSLHERQVGPALPPSSGQVTFQNVTYGYNPQQPVLRGFQLTIAPGEMVALIGSSGAGKTTVVSLLLNYYDPDSGAITVDGADVRGFTTSSVRQQIAAVLQEPMLFQTSIRENLRYGRLDATDAEIEAAAQAIGADTFIRRLPEGYDTQVGPRGTKLSGGQRQRIALARAMLKQAPIVVLDEATSALDPVGEGEVLRGMRPWLAERAVLVVAHRLTTVMHADRIAVLSEGRVAELGTHAELVTLGGLYYQFYQAQLDASLLAATPVAA